MAAKYKIKFKNYVYFLFPLRYFGLIFGHSEYSSMWLLVARIFAKALSHLCMGRLL